MILLEPTITEDQKEFLINMARNRCSCKGYSPGNSKKGLPLLDCDLCPVGRPIPCEFESAILGLQKQIVYLKCTAKVGLLDKEVESMLFRDIILFLKKILTQEELREILVDAFI